MLLKSQKKRDIQSSIPEVTLLTIELGITKEVLTTGLQGLSHKYSTE